VQNIQNALGESLSIDGVLGAAFADWRRGESLAYQLSTDASGFSQAEMMLLVASSSEVIRNKATQSEKSGEKIAEIIFVYEEFFYIIRVANAITGLFFLLVLEQDKANLAHARLKLAQIASEIELAGKN